MITKNRMTRHNEITRLNNRIIRHRHVKLPDMGLCNEITRHHSEKEPKEKLPDI